MPINESTLSTYPLTPPFTEFIPSGSGLNNRVVGVRCAEGDFICKFYQTHADPATILYEHRLLHWLDRSDLALAVPAPLRAHDGSTLVSSDQGWFALFKYLPGDPPDRVRLDHIHAAGDALGQLHRVLVDCPFAARPNLHSYGELRRVHPAIPAPQTLSPADVGLPATPEWTDLFTRWRADVADLEDFVRDVYVHLPWQMTHGDYTPGNILVREDRASAVLDFDMAQPDARAIDIAAGLKYSMNIHDLNSTKNRTRIERIGQIPADQNPENPPESAESAQSAFYLDPLAFGTAFWQGYTQWVTPTDAEIAAIPNLIRLRNAVSAIWWLGRGLANGDISRGVRRIQEMQTTKEWMGENDDEMMRMMG
ncbi:MAG: phosphotransferase [Caldilineaceae bacterium]